MRCQPYNQCYRCCSSVRPQLIEKEFLYCKTGIIGILIKTFTRIIMKKTRIITTAADNLINLSFYILLLINKNTLKNKNKF
ncbi:hypothetical protein pb186bvf_015567 [Paramecium bursaria]